MRVMDSRRGRLITYVEGVSCLSKLPKRPVGFLDIFFVWAEDTSKILD